MGLCGGKNLSPAEKERLKVEAKRNKEVEAMIRKDYRRDQSVHKLLLLGAGESGKSTVLKQMKLIHGKGFSEEEAFSFIEVIYNNIIAAIQELCKRSLTMTSKFLPANEPSRQFVLELKDQDPIDEEVAGHIDKLWSDPGIQETYEQRAKFQLIDTAKYYFDQVHRVGRADYTPSDEDIVHSRVRTTGIVDNKFNISNNTFNIFDVGGQRNERKKWIHCFEDVTAVLFIAALSGYDQMLYEDEKSNRMDEALRLFEQMCNSEFFIRTPFILFLNKMDLFREKVKKVPLTACPAFADFSGSQDYESAVAYIERKFLERKRIPDKYVYTHATCATDQNNMRYVFEVVKDIVLRKSLSEGGLLGIES